MFQFPDPPPGDYPHFPPSLFECIALVFIIVFAVGLCLPRPWFKQIFRAAFPFMPERLEDLDKK